MLRLGVASRRNFHLRDTITYVLDMHESLHCVIRRASASQYSSSITDHTVDVLISITGVQQRHYDGRGCVNTTSPSPGGPGSLHGHAIHTSQFGICHVACHRC